MLRNLPELLWPHPAVAATFAVLAAIAGVALTYHAARRTVTRPLALALEDETTLLAGVLSDLRRYPYLSTISTSDFAAGTHARIWDALQTALGDDATVSDNATDADCAAHGAALAARSDAIRADLLATLSRGPAARTDHARYTTLLAHATSHQLDAGADCPAGPAADAAVLASAEAVLAGGNDRNRLSGTGLVLPTKTPDSTDPATPPLERVHVPPTRRRVAVTAALTAAAASIVPAAVAAAHLTGPAGWAATGALLALLAMSVVVALVDLDTMYIDMRTWVVGTLVSWALTAVAALAAHDPSRLLIGVVLVTGVAVVFEGTNLVFKKIRGQDGQGFGDTLIIVATVGAPSALTGSVAVGFWCFMGGLLAAIAGWSYGAITGRVTRHTPFAFGPWLAAGWVIALALFVTQSTLLTA